MKRLVAIAALAAIPTLIGAPAFAASAVPTGHHAPRPTATPSAEAMTGYENEVVRLTNVQRTSHGCPALHIDERLRTAARGHSSDMVNERYFSHTGSNGSNFVTRETAAGYPRRSASAENIAWGFRTPDDVVSAWMHSPGHRANILNCGSRAVGVGLAYNRGGAAYWTQDFGRS